MAITMMTIMFDICGGPACDVGVRPQNGAIQGLTHRIQSRLLGLSWATLYVSLEAATLWWAGREGLMLVLAHASCSVRGSGAVQDCRMVPIIKLLTKKCHPRIHGTRVTFLSLTQ